MICLVKSGIACEKFGASRRSSGVTGAYTRHIPGRMRQRKHDRRVRMEYTKCKYTYNLVQVTVESLQVC
jgi:hypothetical protein